MELSYLELKLAQCDFSIAVCLFLKRLFHLVWA